MMTGLELRMAIIANRARTVDGSGGGEVGEGSARGRSGSRTSESHFTQAQYYPVVSLVSSREVWCAAEELGIRAVGWTWAGKLKRSAQWKRRNQVPGATQVAGNLAVRVKGGV